MSRTRPAARFHVAVAAVVAALLAAPSFSAPARAQTDGQEAASGGDRHLGYYYPELTGEEVYAPRGERLPNASKTLRLGFVTQITKQQLEGPYQPAWAMFAKGEDSEKMIITALDDGVFATTYRMRGFLAQMTAMARTTRFFQDTGAVEDLTFLDLLHALGFTQLTITDGRSVAHRFTLGD